MMLLNARTSFAEHPKYIALPRMEVEDLQAMTAQAADQGPHYEEETKPRLGISLALFGKA